MIAIILDNGWQDSAFLDAHANGVKEVENSFADFPVKEALKVCGLEYEQVKDCLPAFRQPHIGGDVRPGRSHEPPFDPGQLSGRDLAGDLRQNRGGRRQRVHRDALGRLGFTLPPKIRTRGGPPPPTYRPSWGSFHLTCCPKKSLRTGTTGCGPSSWSGPIPYGPTPTPRPMNGPSGNSNLLVAVDVAMSETAAMAHYVLPGRTAYESYDSSFWSYNYPEIFFQLRRPVVEPKPETRETGWIMTSLAEKLGVYS